MPPVPPSPRVPVERADSIHRPAAGSVARRKSDLMSLRGLAVVDMFCGVGGLTHGFVREGLGVAAGIDSDVSCRYAYEVNNGATFHHLDVGTLTSREIAELFPANSTRVLVGCAPCQPFSSYNRCPVDGRWSLVDRFAELVVAVRPDIVSMENVPALKRHPVFKSAVRRLEQAGYLVRTDIVDCAQYGVPQTRKRLVLLASLHSDLRLMSPEEWGANPTTVRDFIESMERIEAGQASDRDPLHRSSALSEANLRRISATPAGGGWADWPQELRLQCHERETGKSYPSIYGRMHWDDLAPTLTTQFHTLGTGRWGHPEQDRALSLREAALLQTFPPDYEFCEGDEVAMGRLARHIGNAVPVELGRVIARSVKRHWEDRVA